MLSIITWNIIVRSIMAESRQQVWQERRKAEGKCKMCGKKRGKTGSPSYCRVCLDKKNEKQKERRAKHAESQRD